MYKADFSLTGKVALVTGAGRGIGRAIAEGLAHAGADVALMARTEEQVRLAALDIREITGRNTWAGVCDVRDHADIETTVATVLETFGKIDILVNNAGVTVQSDALHLTEAQWDDVLDTNLKSVFFMSQTVARHMVPRNYGRIVNIASLASELTLAHATPYPPSKAGLVHLTHQLAAEWARYGITVNAISPSFFETSMNTIAFENEKFLQAVQRRGPMRRLGKLEELVAPTVFFCSDSASYVTGQNLCVDGGALHFGL